MSYDGLHYIKCHVKLPTVSAIPNYEIAWDYNEIIKSIKISFNGTIIEEITKLVNEKIKPGFIFCLMDKKIE